MNWEEKVVVVTGGAKGIGKAIAEKFAEMKAAVAIVDFDAFAGPELEQVLQAGGANAAFIQADVSDASSLKNAREKVVQRFSHIDILIVNAGVSQKQPLDQLSYDEWDRVIKVNLSGSFYTIKAFWKDFKDKKAKDEGKIVFVTSGSAITGTGGGAHYAASKAGQHGLMRAVSKELGPNGVNVNAVAPRVIQTELLDHLYPTEKSRQELVKTIPIGRIGQPEDVANLTVFLSSPESSYMTGQIILSDGGRTY